MFLHSGIRYFSAMEILDQPNSSPSERATIGRRFSALFIDWMVATFSTGLFYPLFASSLAPSLFRLGVFVVEVGLLTALTGASIGQRALKIRVVSFPERLFIKPTSAFLRTFLIALVIPALVIDRDGRGLHDRITRSQVIKAE